jgi:hypothetical protein
MNNLYALLSLVYMMSFVVLFDRWHNGRRWQPGGRLLRQCDLDRIQHILSACQEE